VNFPSFETLREGRPYPGSLPRDGRFLSIARRHRLLIVQPKFADHVAKGLLSDPISLGLQANPAGAYLVISSFSIGVLPTFFFRDQAGEGGSDAAGPAEPVLEIIAVETQPKPHVVKVLRALELDAAFDAALRQALREMKQAAWPLSAHVRWWIDCESKGTAIELAATCSARGQARDIRPKEAGQDR
jgi:hypothetical protein